MAFIRTRFILKDIELLGIKIKCRLSTSCLVNNKWRKEQGLEPNPNTFGPLTNLPDFSFLDGRPVPLSNSRLEKIQLQQKYCERIVELTNEIDVGLKNYHERQKQIQKEREDIINNKLKPKGDKLLETKVDSKKI